MRTETRARVAESVITTAKTSHHIYLSWKTVEFLKRRINKPPEPVKPVAEHADAGLVFNDNSMLAGMETLLGEGRMSTSGVDIAAVTI